MIVAFHDETYGVVVTLVAGFHLFQGFFAGGDSGVVDLEIFYLQVHGLDIVVGLVDILYEDIDSFHDFSALQIVLFFGFLGDEDLLVDGLGIILKVVGIVEDLFLSPL